MKNIDIIVMGKTGAGKSTLINAVLEEDLAPTGTGQAVTKENEVYSKQMMLSLNEHAGDQYGMVGCRLNMYDTVGLEIDHSITEQTLAEIKKHIEETKSRMEAGDLHLVWFCIYDRSSRFEPYELELIKSLSIDHEIPFVIVLTQCFSDEEGELENQIKSYLPEVSVRRVLAKEASTRGGKIPAYGIPALLRTSVNDYRNLKFNILESKLNTLDWRRMERINQLEARGNEIISEYASTATKIGFIPVLCIPIVHGVCVKMIADLNKLIGLRSDKSFADEIFSDVVVGILSTPLMAIPLISAAAASAYVETTGEGYLKALLNIIYLSSDRELQDNALIKQRLTKELNTLKK
jgi:Predicted GTPase